MKRVVITGMGAISPMGCGVTRNWEELVKGSSGIRLIEHFETGELQSKIAGLVPEAGSPGGFDPAAVFSGKEQRRNDLFILYAMGAAEEAIRQSGWVATTDQDRERTGVIFGSAIGGFQTLVKGSTEFNARGKDGLSAFFIPGQLINLASGQIAIKYGFWGPDYSVVGACATGAEAIAAGARSILLDEIDVAIVGGADAAVHPLCIAGFEKIHALSTGYNDRPSAASRPFDVDRNGFVLGEGAGSLVLEEYEHAKARGATILAELRGFASASDGHHVAASHPEGLGEQRALRQALERAKIAAQDIGYLNAHATSTPIGDSGELQAVRAVFGSTVSELAISSTKSATGHTFGAAGALEAIYSICALRTNLVPPTLNLDNPDPEFRGLNLVPKVAQERPLTAVVSNSFGFGATKVALVFARCA